MSTYKPSFDTTNGPQNALPYALYLQSSFAPLNYVHINRYTAASDESPYTSTSTGESVSSWSSTLSVFGDNKYAPSMDSVEKELFRRTTLKTLDSTSGLLINTLLALAAYYIRCNSFKAFKNFGSSTPEAIEGYHKFRKILMTKSYKYYGLAIHRLRILLASKDYNITIAIISSSILNKISIYEYSDLYHCVTFSKGVVGLFNDLLSNINSPIHLLKRKEQLTYTLNDVSWIINFFIFAFKSMYFPTYDPALLSEYKDMMLRFKSILQQQKEYGQQPPSIVVFHFNHLQAYTEQLLEVIQSHNTVHMDQYPIILYKLLRQWLIILPSKMHILTYLSDPIERTLMHLFRALTKILDHIFPAVMFYFLQSFSGGLSIWFDNTSDYKDHYSDMTEAQQNPLFQELRIIEVYCIRVASFFRKRSNILSMMFGDQRLKQELSPQVIQNNINEVMIKSFNRTQIRFYHYLHFPKVVSFTKTNAVLHNLHYRFNGNSLYYNNQSHYQHFLSNNSSKISKSILTSTNVDPIIRFHMHNLSKLDVEGTQEEQNLEVIDSQSDRNLRRPLFGADVSAINEYGSSTHSTHTSNASFSSSSASGSPQESVTSPSAPQGNPSSPGGSANPWTPVTYYTIFDDSFSKVLATRISKDYEELFKSAEDDDIVRSLNSINGSLIEIDLKSDTGLMKRDRDPLNIIMEMNTNPFKRRLQNLFTSTQIYNLIENFYNLRNQKLSKYLDHYTVATASSSNFDYESSSTALHQANKPELKQKHHKSAKKKAASKSGTRDSPELLHDANDNKTTSEVDNFYDDLNVRYFNL